MGRWSYSNRQEAEYLRKVDIYWLKKYGYLDGWKSGGIEWTHGWSGNKNSIGIEGNVMDDKPYVRLHYTITRQSGEKKEIDYKVYLATTKCNFGGKRYWFVCPLSVDGKYCGRRVGTLYSGGDYYGCRHCYNLTYESRKLSGASKVAGKVISVPELERLENEVKRKYYAGKMTRKYKQFIKKQEKSTYQLMVMASSFDKGIAKRLKNTVR